jgi:hypothetical protein
MDPDTVYVKTASGEAAMQQRTRAMQRNVRMVLILVDGQSTVADLSRKTRNPQLTEKAIRELEEGGFVERRADQDSLWAESRKVAQEIRSAAIDKALQVSPPKARGNSAAAGESSSTLPISIHSEFQAQPRSASSTSQSTSEFPRAPAPSGQVAAERPLPDAAQTGTEKSSAEQPRRVEEARLPLRERIKAFLPRASQHADDAVSLKPIRRGRRNSLGWPAIVMIGIVGVLALTFLTVALFPYASYLPEVEAAMAQSCARPVKVAAMRVDVYPKPGLFLDDVRVGAGNDELRFAEIRLQPALGTLLASKMIFRQVVLSGATIPAELIAGLPNVFAALAKPTARAGVERISLENAEISFGGLGFSGMAGEATLSAAGSFESLLLYAPDRSLSVEVKPRADAGRALDVSLEGLGWRPAQNSRYLLDTVSLRGSLENGALSISSLEIHLFDGVVKGAAVLRADKKPSISGDLVFERINASRFGDALGLGQQFSGETAGKMSFSAAAASWAEIFSAISADGEFTTHRGSVRGIDLAEAVRRVSNVPTQGGTTLFEQLSGKIKLTPASYQFSELVMNSGLMQSSGHLEVSKDLKVNGRMELQMRGTANQTRVPISISGSLKTPAVQAGRG